MGDDFTIIEIPIIPTRKRRLKSPCIEKDWNINFPPQFLELEKTLIKCSKNGDGKGCEECKVLEQCKDFFYSHVAHIPQKQSKQEYLKQARNRLREIQEAKQKVASL
jgi:hypothetical protein